MTSLQIDGVHVQSFTVYVCKCIFHYCVERTAILVVLPAICTQDPDILPQLPETLILLLVDPYLNLLDANELLDQLVVVRLVVLNRRQTHERIDDAVRAHIRVARLPLQGLAESRVETRLSNSRDRDFNSSIKIIERIGVDFRMFRRRRI